MDVLRSSKPKARKDHRCNYCNGKIHKGEIYDSQTITSEDGIYVWKSHLRCGEIVSALDMHHDVWDGLTEEDFVECIRNEYYNLLTTEDKELYNSRGFKFPQFSKQLDYVCEKKLKTLKN